MIAYLIRLMRGHSYTGDPKCFDKDKADRARILGQMDRQLTDAEWKEFGYLVRDGY